MVYSTVAKVQAYLNNLGGPGIDISPTSEPSDTQVLEWVTELSAEVDAYLRNQGYSVPVTGTTDLAILSRYVSMKAAVLTWEAGFMTDELPGKIRAWRNEWDRFLERLSNGTLTLVEQSGTARTGTVFVSSYLEDGDV
jgi:phage gp36-like protein